MAKERAESRSACDTSDDHFRQVVEGPESSRDRFPDRNTWPHWAPIAPRLTQLQGPAKWREC